MDNEEDLLLDDDDDDENEIDLYSQYHFNDKFTNYNVMHKIKENIILDLRYLRLYFWIPLIKLSFEGIFIKITMPMYVRDTLASKMGINSSAGEAELLYHWSGNTLIDYKSISSNYLGDSGVLINSIRNGKKIKDVGKYSPKVSKTKLTKSLDASYKEYGTKVKKPIIKTPKKPKK